MWAPSPGQNAERRQSVGAPLVGALPRAKRREKTIGRGAPCGCPPQVKRREKTIGRVPSPGQNAERRQSVGAPLVGALPRSKRREKTIRRGTPCGRPPQGQNAERRQSVGAPLVGALRGLLWRPNLDAIALFPAPLRGPSWSKKMFSVANYRVPVESLKTKN